MQQQALPAPGFETLDALIQGSVLLLDKPYGWTSYDLVNKLKWFIRNNLPHIPFSGPGKLRIGHAGTLDPLATGLVVLCTGRCTRLIDSLQEGTKVYTGSIFLGQTTPSYDLETAPSGNFPTEHINRERIDQVAESFLGEQMQQPPAYSAKQVDGQRAYRAARKGRPMDLPSVPVTIQEFRITAWNHPDVEFEITCSKGTYIRSIAHDFGQRLQTGSYLKSLRRESSNPYSVNEAMDPAGLQSLLVEAFRNSVS